MVCSILLTVSFSSMRQLSQSIFLTVPSMLSICCLLTTRLTSYILPSLRITHFSFDVMLFLCHYRIRPPKRRPMRIVISLQCRCTVKKWPIVHQSRQYERYFAMFEHHCCRIAKRAVSACDWEFEENSNPQLFFVNDRYCIARVSESPT